MRTHFLPISATPARDAHPACSWVIEIETLTRRFRTISAVDANTLRVPGGKNFGLLGPTGAGKTTTVKILIDLKLSVKAIIPNPSA